ncbi:inositol 2-dehydrogenase [Alkalispirochaeta sphaeroplastigenens]|uniref:Inositol 2-dehydrogenase n=1 Tax=Alkalispirochaeta sphaeroplastigenens TaxID=1187066 RepID=A0A2S4JHV1_9SPIO|nr:inositol 2-dehydrogenase [Alkalispirochaeta sphaeroplastigenens]POQ99127.1 inositol 2-dehydrogenase [Alkalispirochaeta sphaeroplastigenens]
MAEKKDSIRIGVIGTGRIGYVHAKNLVQRVQGVEVVCVADPYVDRATEWLDELGITERYTDPAKVLNHDKVDAVYICSSTDTHADFLVDAAKAGKHIFCEKPIDLDVEKVKNALEVAKKAGVTLQIGFNRRFDHNFAAVKQAILDKKVGDLHMIKVTSRDPEPPPAEYVKVSGGIFLDMMIHDLDMVRFLSGSEVKAVSAAGAVLVDPAIGEAGDIDTAVVTLWLENGAIAVIDISRKAVYGYDQRVEVFGSAGMARTENDLPATIEITGIEGSRKEKPLWFFLERYNESFLVESEAFVKALREGTTPPVVGVDGLEPMYLAMAAKKSLEEKRVVEISEVR